MPKTAGDVLSFGKYEFQLQIKNIYILPYVGRTWNGISSTLIGGYSETVFITNNCAASGNTAILSVGYSGVLAGNYDNLGRSPKKKKNCATRHIH